MALLLPSTAGLWSRDQKLKLIAIKVKGAKYEPPGDYTDMVGQKTNGSSLENTITRLKINANGKFPLSNRKSILLHTDALPINEVKTLFPKNSDQTMPLQLFDSFPLIKAITKSEYLIRSEKDIYSFFYYTKFKTFGLFRLNLGLTGIGNDRISHITSDEVYLLMLAPNEFTQDICYSCEEP